MTSSPVKVEYELTEAGRDVMQMVAPAGNVYQAGTLSGNPLAMTAGIETLKELQKPDVWKSLEARSAQLMEGVTAIAKKTGTAVTTQRVGTMFTSFFADHPITNWATAKVADTKKFGMFFQALLEAGVYIAPSQFEAGFISTAHTDSIVDTTLAVAERALQV